MGCWEWRRRALRPARATSRAVALSRLTLYVRRWPWPGLAAYSADLTSERRIIAADSKCLCYASDMRRPSGVRKQQITPPLHLESVALIWHRCWQKS